MTTILRPVPLTAADFRPFGDVIETAGAESFPINEGTTTRFHDLAHIDVSAEGGHALVNLFRGRPRALPLPIRLVERHPLGSQAFVPLTPRRFLVVVADAGDTPGAADLHAFITAPGQGVNYARNVWHHPLIALDEVSDFLVIDRGGPGDNLVEYDLSDQDIALAR